MTVLNIVGIVSVARANFLLLALQIVFIAVFVVMAVVTISGAGSVNLMAPFTGDGTVGGASPIFAGAAILCLSFLGFDAVSTLSEEAKDADPQRAQGDHDRHGGVRADLLRPVVRVPVGVPLEQLRRRRLGLAGRDDHGGRPVPEHVLHRRLRRRLHRLRAHLAGVGGQNLVRDGPRRHPAATGVRPYLRCGSPPRPTPSWWCR